jgi:hypothetical protein
MVCSDNLGDSNTIYLHEYRLYRDRRYPIITYSASIKVRVEVRVKLQVKGKSEVKAKDGSHMCHGLRRSVRRLLTLDG